MITWSVGVTTMAHASPQTRVNAHLGMVAEIVRHRCARKVVNMGGIVHNPTHARVKRVGRATIVQ